MDRGPADIGGGGINGGLSGRRNFDASDYDPNPPREPRAAQKSIAGEEEPFTVKCICNFLHYDGNVIFCAPCETWQHIECYYPDHIEDALHPDFAHSCVDCEPRTLDRQRAIARWRGRGLTPSSEPPTTLSPPRGPSTARETTVQLQAISNQIIEDNDLGARFGVPKQ